MFIRHLMCNIKKRVTSRKCVMLKGLTKRIWRGDLFHFDVHHFEDIVGWLGLVGEEREDSVCSAKIHRSAVITHQSNHK